MKKIRPWMYGAVLVLGAALLLPRSSRSTCPERFSLTIPFLYGDQWLQVHMEILGKPEATPSSWCMAGRASITNT